MKKINNVNINTPDYWQRFNEKAWLNADKKRGKCKMATVAESLVETDNILDVGCLSGNFREYLLEQEIRVTSFTGLDQSLLSIQNAKEKFSADTWILSDCYSMPFKDKTFDKVIAMELLEHLDRPLDFLKEAARVLKNQSNLIITVPNQLRIKSPEHVWSFSLAGLIQLLLQLKDKKLYFESIFATRCCSNARNLLINVKILKF